MIFEKLFISSFFPRNPYEAVSDLSILVQSSNDKLTYSILLTTSEKHCCLPRISIKALTRSQLIFKLPFKNTNKEII